MGDDSEFSTETQPTLQQLADYILDGLFDVKRLARVENALRNAHAEGATIAHGATFAGVSSGLDQFAGSPQAAVDYGKKLIGWLLAWAVAEIIGTEVPESALDQRTNAPGQSVVGRAVAETVFSAIRGDETELTPGTESAKRMLATSAHMTVHGWFVGVLIEKLEKVFSLTGEMESLAKLAEELVNSMGLGRIASRALRPLAQVVISTPLQWQLHKDLRPNLLSEADILKAFIRGDYTNDQAAEELARLGYSDKRQDVLLHNAFKNLSLEDALVLERHGVIDRALVLEMLKAEGYDESVAQHVLIAAEAKRQTSIDDNAIGALTHAYVNRDLDEHGLRTLFPPNVYSDLELDTFETQARLQRDLNIRHLSEGDVIRAVRLEVVPMAYYRGWMTREGIPDDEQLIKELLLRAEIDKEFKVDQARAAALADRAAEKAARDRAAKDRQAQIEQERALARRGPVSELLRAVVRGLIAPARLQEVLAAQYDADTVQIFMDDAAQQRAELLEQQRKADELKNRAKVRHVDVGTYEQAVINDILTLDQFRRAMLSEGFVPADADLLTANLRVRKGDYDAAVQKRRDAETRAKTKAIDLGKFEQLVRRGVRTVEQYAALLRTLDFDDAAIAGMTELLQLQIADDQKARDERAAAAAVRDSKGLSLADARRAVILELQTVDWFQTWLVANKFTTDAQAVLVAELRSDLAEAARARERRQAADLIAGALRIPLSTVARAARLGLITPALYQQRLQEAGYSDDDIAIELALLTQEIADVQAARAKQAAADKPAAPGLLTLTQMAAAVRAGVRPLAAYQSLAVADGLDDTSVTTLVRVLGDELAGTTAARLRREQLGSELSAKDVNLSALEAQVRAGDATLAEFSTTLVQAGLDPVDAALLTALLGDELASAGLGG